MFYWLFMFTTILTLAMINTITLAGFELFTQPSPWTCWTSLSHEALWLWKEPLLHFSVGFDTSEDSNLSLGLNCTLLYKILYPTQCLTLTLFSLKETLKDRLKKKHSWRYQKNFPILYFRVFKNDPSWIFSVIKCHQIDMYLKSVLTWTLLHGFCWY